MKKIKKCQKIRECITDSLVDELSPVQEQELQQHLQECSECMNEYNEMKKILSLTTESLQSNKYSWSDKRVKKEYSTVIDINCLSNAFAEERQSIVKKRRLFAWRYGLPIAACLAILAVSIDAVIEKYHVKNKTIAAASQNMGEDGLVLDHAVLMTIHKSETNNIFTDTLVDVKGIDFDKINSHNIKNIIKLVNTQLAKNNAPKLIFKRELLAKKKTEKAEGSHYKHNEIVSDEPTLIREDHNLQQAFKRPAKGKAFSSRPSRMKEKVVMSEKKNISNKITLQELLSKLQKHSLKWHYDNKKKQIIISYEP